MPRGAAEPGRDRAHRRLAGARGVLKVDDLKAVGPVEDVTFDVRGTFQSAPSIHFVRSDYPFAAVADASFIVDAAIRYSMGHLWPTMPFRSFDLFVDGRNLTDRRYKQPSGRPAVNPTGTPQPPLQVMAGLEFEI